MKKYSVMIMSAALVASSCTTGAGTGAYAGSSLGSVLGSAMLRAICVLTVPRIC